MNEVVRQMQRVCSRVKAKHIGINDQLHVVVTMLM